MEHLEEIRFLLWTFEWTEVAKIWQQREDCGMELCLPSWTSTTSLLYSLVLSQGLHIIIKAVRICDCITYSLAALQALWDGTPRLDSSPVGRESKRKGISKKKAQKAKVGFRKNAKDRAKCQSILFLSHVPYPLPFFFFFLTFEKSEIISRWK